MKARQHKAHCIMPRLVLCTHLSLRNSGARSVPMSLSRRDFSFLLPPPSSLPASEARPRLAAGRRAGCTLRRWERRSSADDQGSSDPAASSCAAAAAAATLGAATACSGSRKTVNQQFLNVAALSAAVLSRWHNLLLK